MAKKARTAVAPAAAAGAAAGAAPAEVEIVSGVNQLKRKRTPQDGAPAAGTASNKHDGHGGSNGITSSNSSVGGAGSSRGSSGSSSGSKYILVQRVPAPRGGHAAPAIGVEDPLRCWLFPMKPETFMREHYRKRPVAVLGGGMDRCAEFASTWMADLDVRSLLEVTASDKVFCWFRNRDDGKIGSIGVESAAEAMTCHGAGASLYCRSSPELAAALVTPLSQDVGMGFAGFYPNGDERGEIEVFFSRAGHLTDWHFDFQENFTLQLKGRKKWTMAPSTITHPLRGCTPHYNTYNNVEEQMKVHRMQDPGFKFRPDSFPDEDSVILEPGDVLYHPAAAWHKVEALEDSISINVSLLGLTWADIAADTVKQLLWSSNEWRGIVSADSEEDMHAKLGKLLKELPAMLKRTTPTAIAPSALFEEDRIVVTSDDSVLEGKKVVTGLVRRNPLGACVKASDIPESRAALEDGAAHDGDSKCEDESSCDEEQDHGDGEDEGDEDDEEDDDDDEDIAPPPGHIEYRVHVGFGNDNLDSRLNLRLHVPEEDVSAMDWVLSHPMDKVVSVKDWTAAVPACAASIPRLCGILLHVGVLVDAAAST